MIVRTYIIFEHWNIQILYLKIIILHTIYHVTQPVYASSQINLHHEKTKRPNIDDNRNENQPGEFERPNKEPSRFVELAVFVVQYKNWITRIVCTMKIFNDFIVRKQQDDLYSCENIHHYIKTASHHCIMHNLENGYLTTTFLTSSCPRELFRSPNLQHVQPNAISTHSLQKARYEISKVNNTRKYQREHVKVLATHHKPQPYETTFCLYSKRVPRNWFDLRNFGIGPRLFHGLYKVF